MGNPIYPLLHDAYSNYAPLRRTPSTEEIIDLVQYLLSSASSAITGERIYVDGGFNHLSAAVSALKI
ncbi:SDR family NAD(P)-dependent oxidoreductase [Pseudomonas sp. RIT412]|nr:SDR family NAD(P)-dependent oxidoreductase [Pseudomonas sp. RIT 409]RAU51908.1 SDR family NAD(P)-dependent oxidoreductase [Pseudomonas sp. RIT 412]